MAPDALVPRSGGSCVPEGSRTHYPCVQFQNVIDNTFLISDAVYAYADGDHELVRYIRIADAFGRNLRDGRMLSRRVHDVEFPGFHQDSASYEKISGHNCFSLDDQSRVTVDLAENDVHALLTGIVRVDGEASDTDIAWTGLPTWRNQFASTSIDENTAGYGEFTDGDTDSMAGRDESGVSAVPARVRNSSIYDGVAGGGNCGPDDQPGTVWTGSLQASWLSMDSFDRSQSHLLHVDSPVITVCAGSANSGWETAPAPELGTRSERDRFWVQATAIASAKLPTIRSGVGKTTNGLALLPNDTGLSFDASTPALSGTPGSAEKQKRGTPVPDQGGFWPQTSGWMRPRARLTCAPAKDSSIEFEGNSTWSLFSGMGIAPQDGNRGCFQ